MKARFGVKKKPKMPLNDEQSSFVTCCVDRYYSMLRSTLRVKPEYTMIVVPTLVDYSNRKFENIPLFTYILWTGHYAWMEGFIHEDDLQKPGDRFVMYDNLLNQLKAFNKKGVTFTIGDKVYKKQFQYSDKEHIAALKEYVEKYPNLTEEERKNFWIKNVGSKQRLVEKHIALDICHVDRTPSFSLTIFKADEKLPKPVWFPLSESKLGEEYAICLTDKGAVACEAPDPVNVKLMIHRLEALEQSKADNRLRIEITLRKLRDEMKDIFLQEQLQIGSLYK